MIVTGTIILAIGVAIFLIELGVWLNTGAWPSYNLLWLLGPAPMTGWSGFDQIVGSFCSLPFWGVVTLIGFAIVFVGASIEGNSLEKWRRTLPPTSRFAKRPNED